MSNNHYVNQIMEQTGMSEREVFASAAPMRPMTFPCEVHGRRFESHDDYVNAMYDYLGAL